MVDEPQTAVPKAPSRRYDPDRNKPPRLQTLIWQRIALAALAGATSRIQALSRPAAMRFGAALGRLGYRVARSKRRLADRNLRLAFGDDMTLPERDALVRRVFQHFGKLVVDFLREPTLNEGGLDRLIVCDGARRAC